jgi:hypothetical protein
VLLSSTSLVYFQYHFSTFLVPLSPNLVPRPEDSAGPATQTSILQEGTEASSRSYVIPYSTELEIRRQFIIPGKQYVLKLVANNLHTTDDISTLTWTIMCGSAIRPQDWSMTYKPYIRPGKVNLRCFG